MKRTDKKIKKVAIFGDAEAKRSDRHFKDAYEVAKMLAENGYGIVNGGGPGVMLAASLGARAGGGRVEIVVLDEKNKPKNFEGECKENTRAADKKIIGKGYEARLYKLVKIADAFVIFEGGTGTLAEVGMVWSLAKFSFGNHEPLIFFGQVWGKIVKAIVEGLNLEAKERQVVSVVEKKEEVLKILRGKE